MPISLSTNMSGIQFQVQGSRFKVQDSTKHVKN